MRYFSVTEAKFAILTNGINYKFFTDLEQTNMMDKKPFLEINLLDIDDNEILQLKKFAKNTFNLEAISSTASNLKYIDNINNRLKEELEALEMIREILSDVVDKEDITYKSTKSYFGINYKNNSNNWICRLLLYRKKQMGIHIPNENKEPIKYDFDEMSDLKEIKPLLEEIVKRYI